MDIKTEELHIFDEVEVRYTHNDKMIILAKDIAQYIITTFLVALEKSLKNELILDESFAIGMVGYFFSKKTYMNVNELKEKNNIFSEYWVWSSDNIQTWLHNIDNKICLEISSTYPWLFSDPDEDESYFSFDEYTKNYEPIMMVTLQETLIQTWINQCRNVLQKIKTLS